MSAGDGASFDAGAVEFRLLGELEVLLSGQRVDAGTARQRAVLAALLVDANRVVPLDELVARVWGTGRRPDRPVNTVQSYVSLLRRALGSVAITRRSGGYVLAVGAPIKPQACMTTPSTCRRGPEGRAWRTASARAARDLVRIAADCQCPLWSEGGPAGDRE